MPFVEYEPSGGLKPFVDAYWVRGMGRRPKAAARRVYADGCADVIANVGPSMAYFNPMARPEWTIPLQPGRLYLGGTMTAYGLVHTEPGALLTGIRFRPGGLYALYRMSMETAVDSLVEFPDPSLLPLMARGAGWTTRLDTYLETRLKPPRHDFASIYRTIAGTGGQVSVEDLAGTCHVSKRTLERIFRLNVGISPKRYIRIARFQQVLARLRQPFSEESLLRMAYDLGYYDHAHLTNEFKQYAGILPSELSRFYKTGIAHGQYF